VVVIESSGDVAWWKINSILNSLSLSLSRSSAFERAVGWKLVSSHISNSRSTCAKTQE
jgi:hypothetical protein